jgi:hypothetical protein
MLFWVERNFVPAAKPLLNLYRRHMTTWSFGADFLRQNVPSDYRIARNLGTRINTNFLNDVLKR